MNQPLGQAAYDALRQSLASRPPDDLDARAAVEWRHLPVAYREAWEAAAQAVLAEYNSQQCGPRAEQG